MTNEIGFFVAVLATVFAIVDPFGTLPFFVRLTDGYGASDRLVILRRSILVLGTVLAVFAIAGRLLFAAFGFTLQAFEIAGGILLFLVAYDMLQGEISRAKLTASDREEALARRDEISVVPLGIPLLAGPGAISTVMIYAGSADGDPVSFLAILLAVAIVTAASALVLYFGQRILRYLGRVGAMALTRVMGLLLAAAAIQFVVNGVRTLVTGG